QKLQYALGFDTGLISVSTLAKYEPDIRAGLDELYIYCCIIEPQIIGYTSAHVIKIVPVRGKFGDMQDIDFPNIHYVKVLSKLFQHIQISIKGSDGVSVPFEFGKVVLKLHFRRSLLL
ncbi:MAG: hypothetical protein P8X78_03995, partial [Nitrosopumilaceae archaeon]